MVAMWEYALENFPESSSIVNAKRKSKDLSKQKMVADGKWHCRSQSTPEQTK
jgi:hypothetical protein